MKSREPIAIASQTEAKPFWFAKLEQPGLICLVLAAAIFLVFCPAARFEFVNYDDPDYVSANPHVQTGLTWQSVRWAFTSGHASNWHPITWLSHMLDWQLFGSNPGPQHLVSAAFHAINTVLLFLVLRRMTGALWQSVSVAALFGLHPLHVESVAWISERKDVLSGLFLLLTLGAYCRYVECHPASVRNAGFSRLAPLEVQVGKGSIVPTPAPNRNESCHRNISPETHWLWYSFALICFALGLMSKPTLVTLPFWLLLVDYWPLERFRLDKNDSKKALALILEKTPFFLLAAGASVVTFLVQRSGGAVSTTLSFSERVANAMVSYVRYLGKTVWPENLSVLYPHPGHWPAWQVCGAGLALVIIVATVVWLARRRPYVAVGWFWFMGGLVPVIGLVQVGVQSMADRYTYLPSIGLFILIVWGIAEAVEYWHLPRPAVDSLTVATLIACAVLTSHQIRFWHDSEALFQRAVEVTSNNYLAYNNLGFDLWKKGRFQEAKENYQKSLAINPQYPDALNNMGFAFAGEKKYAEAIPYYEAALRVAPKQPEVHNNLGNALSELGKLNEAVEQYGIVLSQDPGHADAHNNLGIALAMQGKLEEAVGHFRASLRAKPDYAGALSNLGNALAAEHRFPEAILEYQESLRLNPNDAQAYNNLGNALAEQGRVNEAIDQYAHALRLNTNNPETHFNLAIALLKANKRDEAVAHLQQTLQLNPAHFEARRQLQLLSADK
jgi:tetratricopeptide (TPR) repeat protein